MASQVTSDGHVIPPLNISAPAPFLDLRGFHWTTVDEKILGPQPDQATHQSSRAAAAVPFQKPVAAISEAPVAPVAPAANGATSLPAPQLPAQLPLQLGIAPGKAPPPPPRFPLAQFQGAYAGNGFNTIWRPRAQNDNTEFVLKPDNTDNILELNLTTEQLTFGGTIGGIPNRGLNINKQKTIFLDGIPYLQTVQDVTNPKTGRGDNPEASDIHFEPGMFLFVPGSSSPDNPPSVARMASIPHGTTINAQGLAPKRVSTTNLGGTAGPPNFDVGDNVIDITPFFLGKFDSKIPFDAMTIKKSNDNAARIPQDLSLFNTKGTITEQIIKNPNLTLKNAISGQKIVETITLDFSTGPCIAGPGASKLNGGGTANISFLAGTQNPTPTTAEPGNNDAPNAHAAFMTARFWIETVAYQVNIDGFTTRTPRQFRPTMPKSSTAPTPVFLITPPTKLPAPAQTITVPGIQIQYSQTVNLNFGPQGNILTWPHVSVATLVPSDPQPFTMT